MTAHGGVGRASLRELEKVRATVPELAEARASLHAWPGPGDRARPQAARLSGPEAPQLPPDFRNFGHPGAAPDKNSIYSGLGPAWNTQVAFAKLMRRMALRYDFSDGVSTANDKNFNDRIPAGYTYLGQFAAHDLIRNSVLLADIGTQETGRRNLRDESLNLDSLYGNGPSFDPQLYEIEEPGEGYRNMLRTGSMDPVQIEDYRKAGRCPFAFRDIPRFQQVDHSDWVQDKGKTKITKKVKLGRPDVLIADPRNDDNAMVSQITALFHHLHNAVVTRLRELGDAMPPAVAHEAPKGLHLFLNGRSITTALYRRVLKQDFLKRLLRTEIWELYDRKGFAPLVDDRADGIPVEFSHAALRVCHSMVRMSYVFNQEVPMGEGIRDALKQRSSTRPHKFPPTKNWIADWSRFFDIGPEPPQTSRRIGPCYNEILLSERLFDNALVGSKEGAPPLPDDRPHLPSDDHAGLLLSDLIRGVVGGLQKLDVLIEALPAAVTKLSPLLSDKQARTGRLRKWLAEPSLGFTDAELDSLSGNPPLLLWLLFEAAEETDGKSLGTLGSVIVGDVFFARLRDDDMPEPTELLELIFGKDIPRCMPRLITFTADVLRLHEVAPTFVTMTAKQS